MKLKKGSNNPLYISVQLYLLPSSYEVTRILLCLLFLIMSYMFTTYIYLSTICYSYANVTLIQMAFCYNYPSANCHFLCATLIFRDSPILIQIILNHFIDSGLFPVVCITNSIAVNTFSMLCTKD